MKAKMLAFYSGGVHRGLGLPQSLASASSAVLIQGLGWGGDRGLEESIAHFRKLGVVGGTALLAKCLSLHLVLEVEGDGVLDWFLGTRRRKIFPNHPPRNLSGARGPQSNRRVGY